ncbi:MAG: transcriptional repressor [Deltaproteobacteria bacterium]|nr:transcriptional repressor [Deltaproteobacteria bacterium]
MLPKESIIQKLRQKGLKITPQRLAVIDVLIENRNAHPGAYLVYGEAKKKCRRLSLSSVYATLNEFARHGIIKTLEFDRIENRYEMNLEEHINLVCEKCGRIIDYKIPPSLIQREIAQETGFMVIDKRMDYYGYCSDCINHTQESEDDEKRTKR